MVGLGQAGAQCHRPRHCPCPATERSAPVRLPQRGGGAAQVVGRVVPEVKCHVDGTVARAVARHLVEPACTRGGGGGREEGLSAPRSHGAALYVCMGGRHGSLRGRIQLANAFFSHPQASRASGLPPPRTRALRPCPDGSSGTPGESSGMMSGVSLTHNAAPARVPKLHSNVSQQRYTHREERVLLLQLRLGQAQVHAAEAVRVAGRCARKGDMARRPL